MDNLFPNGVTHYAVGGLLIGAGIGLVYAVTGRIAGVSGILTAVQSWWSRRACFNSRETIEERAWKGTLVLGLIVGAVGVAVLGPVIAADAGVGGAFVTGVQWWRLALGGLLVGIGTRTACGCTSGHGICGVSAFAAPSITSTLIFMGVAIVTARLIMGAGVTP